MTANSRSRGRKLVGLASTAILLMLLSPLQASAQDGPDFDENDQIVLTGRLVIAEGETVDTASILNGPARIDGTVRESLFVLNGDTEVSGTVNGDVVVVNGEVVVRSTAEIGGDLITKGTPRVEDGATIRGSRGNVVTRFDADLTGFAGRFAWWLAYSVSTLVLGLLLLLFAPGLDEGVAAAVRGRTGSSIGWGIGLFFLIPIAAVLLLITVVGIPLGLFVLLGLALIYTVGYAVATLGLGSRVLRPTSSRWAVFLVGWVILRALALIPFVGGLLWLVASVWGLGLLAVTIRAGGSRTTVSPSVPPPPPVPALH